MELSLEGFVSHPKSSGSTKRENGAKTALGGY